MNNTTLRSHTACDNVEQEDFEDMEGETARLDPFQEMSQSQQQLQLQGYDKINMYLNQNIVEA